MAEEGDVDTQTVGSPPTLSPRVARRPKAGTKKATPTEPQARRRRVRAPRTVPDRATNGTTPTKVQPPTDEQEDEQNDEQVLSAESSPTSEVVVVKDATRELFYLIMCLFATGSLIGISLTNPNADSLVEIIIPCIVVAILAVAWYVSRHIDDNVRDLLYLVTWAAGTMSFGVVLWEYPTDGLAETMSRCAQVMAVATVVWYSLRRTFEFDTAKKLFGAITPLACLISVLAVLIVEAFMQQGQSDSGDVIAEMENITNAMSKK